MYSDLKLFQECCEYLLNEEIKHPVATPINTDILTDKLQLELDTNPLDEDHFKMLLKQIISHTPKTASKAFFNQLFGGRIGKATLGELLSVMLNNSMYTYKVAGPQVGIEKEVIKSIGAIIGYQGNYGGTFAPGGSMANFMGMLMARDQFNPDIKNKGVSGKLIAYTSEDAHYSIEKNAAFIGLGRNNVRKIKTDTQGKMSISDLQQQIQNDLNQGYQPFFVNATAGTTVLGVFDDIENISELCKLYDLWLHVDGAYCGGVIFSKAYSYLIKGIEQADSFCFNAHKMLGTPLSCSAILVKNKTHLYQSFSNEAEYLYQTNDDEYNLGKTSIQCGRRNDALKLWTLWKSVGTSGLEEIVNQQFHLANVAQQYISTHPDYSFYGSEEAISVCFNYKNVDPKWLCASLYEAGEIMVGHGSFKNEEFVRLVTINSCLDESDILNFFKSIESFVKNQAMAENFV